MLDIKNPRKQGFLDTHLLLKIRVIAQLRVGYIGDNLVTITFNRVKLNTTS